MKFAFILLVVSILTIGFSSAESESCDFKGSRCNDEILETCFDKKFSTVDCREVERWSYEDKICKDLACEKECKTDNDCGRDLRCKDNRCVEAPPLGCIRENRECELPEDSWGNQWEESIILNTCETGYCFDTQFGAGICKTPFCCKIGENFTARVEQCKPDEWEEELSECEEFAGITEEKIEEAQDQCLDIEVEELTCTITKITTGNITSAGGLIEKLPLKLEENDKIKCEAEDRCQFTIKIKGEELWQKSVKWIDDGDKWYCVWIEEEFDINALNPCRWGSDIGGRNGGCIIGWGIIGVLFLTMMVFMGRK